MADVIVHPIIQVQCSVVERLHQPGSEGKGAVIQDEIVTLGPLSTSDSAGSQWGFILY